MVLGAVAGKSLDILEKHFKWGERWLAGIAAVLALLKLPGLRNWLITRPRSAGALPLGSPPTATSTVAAAAGSITIGALIALGVAPFITPDDDPPPGTGEDGARVFATPEDAIAAQLTLSTVQYVGPCDGSRMEPPRKGGGPADRRVCSVRMRAQEGGYLYGYVSAGGRTQSPLAEPGWGAKLVILREEQGGWQLVRCVVYCAYYEQKPLPP